MPQTDTLIYTERFIKRGAYRIYAREYPGLDPTIILMHGFPDNLHLYDLLLQYLIGKNRIVVFDFLGWGQSDKPDHYPYTAANQTEDLNAVINQLQLKNVVLVAHDASGPPAIDWALENQHKTAGLVLLNTYYCDMPTLKPPEAIWLFSTPLIRNIAQPISLLFNKFLFRKMYYWQVGKFFSDSNTKNKYLPVLYQQFLDQPSAHRAFFSLNKDLRPTIRERSKKVAKLKEFLRPVRIIFGDKDPYLNPGVAEKFKELFPTGELFLLYGARHFVQMDQPEKVARLVLTMSLPLARSSAAESDSPLG